MESNLLRNKAVAVLIALALGGTASAQTANASKDPQIDLYTRAFLKVLNSGTGKQLSNYLL